MFNVKNIQCPSRDKYDSRQLAAIKIFYERILIIRNDDDNDGVQGFEEYVRNLVKWRKQTEEEALTNGINL